MGNSDTYLYGETGSRAADEYKQAIYFKHMQDLCNELSISCFYFSAFDEPWKEKKSNVKYIPTQAEIGDYVLFLSKASIEIELEKKKYLIVSQSAILVLIRDDIEQVLA